MIDSHLTNNYIRYNAVNVLYDKRAKVDELTHQVTFNYVRYYNFEGVNVGYAFDPEKIKVFFDALMVVGHPLTWHYEAYRKFCRVSEKPRKHCLSNIFE